MTQLSLCITCTGTPVHDDTGWYSANSLFLHYVSSPNHNPALQHFLVLEWKYYAVRLDVRHRNVVKLDFGLDT